MHVKIGDSVKVIKGEYRGKSGKVLKVFPRINRVIVEGVNFVKRHSRPTQQNPQGGIVEKEAAIHVSNVMLFISGKTTRIGHRTLESGRKIRFAKNSGEDIDS